MLKSATQANGYDVVIVDPLMEAYPVDEENDNVAANRQMLTFRDLARSTRAALVLVHNSGLRKQKKNSNPTFFARGATSRVDRTDVNINFRSTGSETGRELHVSKSRFGNLNERIRFKFSGPFGYELTGDGADVSQASDPAVMRLLEDVVKWATAETAAGRPDVARRSLIERLSIAKGSSREQMLDRALERGVSLGTLCRPVRGVYTLPANRTGSSLSGEHASAEFRALRAEPVSGEGVCAAPEPISAVCEGVQRQEEEGMGEDLAIAHTLAGVTG